MEGMDGWFWNMKGNHEMVGGGYDYGWMVGLSRRPSALLGSWASGAPSGTPPTPEPGLVEGT